MLPFGPDHGGRHLEELVGLEAGAAHQTAVNVGLRAKAAALPGLTLPP